MATNFTFLDEYTKPQTISLEQSDFTFIQKNRVLTDDKMKSKPTTYFKDALRRFAKNKSSIVGAVILGLLLVLSFIIPGVSTYDVSSYHSQETTLAPKLFESGTGWWDGTRLRKNITVAFDWDRFAKDGTYSGLPADVQERDIVGGTEGITYSQVGDYYTDSANAYAHGGYLRLWTSAGLQYEAESYPALNLPSYSYNFLNDNDYTVTVVTEDAPEKELRKAGNTGGFEGSDGEYAITFDYLSGDGASHSLMLKDFSSTHGTDVFSLRENASLLAAATANGGFFTEGINQAHLSFKIKPGSEIHSLLIHSVSVASKKETEDCSAISFTDANASALADQCKIANHASRSLFHADIVKCTFRFDDYSYAYGERKADDSRAISLSTSQMQTYFNDGYFNFSGADFQQFLTDFNAISSTTEKRKFANEFASQVTLSSLGEEKSPLRIREGEPMVITIVSAGGRTAMSFGGTISMYRYLGYDSMPRFLFGSDQKGQDMLTKTFIGLRTSLLIGIVVSVICMAFGLVWGAISGYFGGWIDIGMERFCEILSGMPWICIMTIALIKFGQSWGTFIIAECATGWIGTAALTRTQFYRFKDREYILAARTLGASDFRLIFRHILPNAIGTLITSMVLMIPSTIFSESTLAYLNLLGGLDSLGVILSDNQNAIQSNPNLIVFPSVIMALIMISFNLFGNGLRDAFNPSLKGED